VHAKMISLGIWSNMIILPQYVLTHHLLSN